MCRYRWRSSPLFIDTPKADWAPEKGRLLWEELSGAEPEAALTSIVRSQCLMLSTLDILKVLYRAEAVDAPRVLTSLSPLQNTSPVRGRSTKNTWSETRHLNNHLATHTQRRGSSASSVADRLPPSHGDDLGSFHHSAAET